MLSHSKMPRSWYMRLPLSGLLILVVAFFAYQLWNSIFSIIFLVPKSNTIFSTSTTSLRYHLAVPLSCIFWVTKKAHNYLLILHIQGRHCDQLWLCPYRRCCLIISHDSFWCLLANNNLLCKFFDKLFDQLRKLFDKFKSLTNPSKIHIFYVIHASSSLTSWRRKIQIYDKPK